MLGAVRMASVLRWKLQGVMDVRNMVYLLGEVKAVSRVGPGERIHQARLRR